MITESAFICNAILNGIIKKGYAIDRGDSMALDDLLNQIDLDMYFYSLPSEVQNKISQHADKINSANDLFMYGERYSQEITNYHFT